MKRTTITLHDDVEAARDAYRRERDLPPALATVVQALVREHLTSHGYLVAPPTRPLTIPVFDGGNGPTDVSIDHDRYLAEWTLERKAGGPR